MLARFIISYYKRDCLKIFFGFVMQLIELNRILNTTSLNTDKSNALLLKIECLNKKIDTEIYKLYDLTEEDIKVIENGNK